MINRIMTWIESNTGVILLLFVAVPPVQISGQEIPLPPSCQPPSNWFAAVAPPQ